MGVDMSTLARWKRRERKPVGVFALRTARFLQDIASATR
jgi:hypothetical protein